MLRFTDLGSIGEHKSLQVVTQGTAEFTKLRGHAVVLGPSQRAIAGENTSRITVRG